MTINRGTITFKAGGEDRQLRYSMNAMVRFQEQEGIQFMDALVDFEKSGTNLKLLRALFWAGLDRGNQDDAGDIIDEIGFQQTAELIASGISAAFPGTKADKEDKSAGNAPKKTTKAT